MIFILAQNCSVISFYNSEFSYFVPLRSLFGCALYATVFMYT